MQPPSEHVHWMFATGFLVLGLCQFGEAIVGTEVWRRRAWRAYLWPSVFFLMGVLMWPVMTIFTNSTIHMLAHGTDRKSTRLNSSHLVISYAVFCLKKKTSSTTACIRNSCTTTLPQDRR